MVLSFLLYVANRYIWQSLCDHFPKKLLPKGILPTRTCPNKLPIPLLTIALRRALSLYLHASDFGKTKVFPLTENS